MGDKRKPLAAKVEWRNSQEMCSFGDMFMYIQMATHMFCIRTVVVAVRDLLYNVAALLIVSAVVSLGFGCSQFQCKHIDMVKR